MRAGEPRADPEPDSGLLCDPAGAHLPDPSSSEFGAGHLSWESLGSGLEHRMDWEMFISMVTSVSGTLKFMIGKKINLYVLTCSERESVLFINYSLMRNVPAEVATAWRTQYF